MPVRINPVNPARPFPSVVAVSPVIVVEGVDTEAVTTVPAWRIGLPLRSCTCTTGWMTTGWRLRARVDGWVITASRAAAPTVMVKGVELTPVRPVALKDSV
jgi:hypothetical protein